MSSMRYVPNNKSFGEFMMSERMGDLAMEIAGSVAILAAMMTPRGVDGDDEYKHLKDGYKVVAQVDVMNGNPRRSAMVYNNSRHAAANEFGTARVPRRHMLARAGARLGEFHPKDGLW